MAKLGTDTVNEMRDWGLVAPEELERIVVISPHLDDAVLGVGRLLAVHPNATVITVYAGRPPEYPDPMTHWDTISGFVAGDDVLARRRKEDEGALAELDATPVWLDFVEHQYLERPDWVGADKTVDVLESAVRAANPTAVFMPFGLANPDHTETHDAARIVRERAARAGVVRVRGPGLQAHPGHARLAGVAALPGRHLAHARRTDHRPRGGGEAARRSRTTSRSSARSKPIGRSTQSSPRPPRSSSGASMRPRPAGNGCRRRRNRPTLLHRSCKPGGTACRHQLDLVLRASEPCSGGRWRRSWSGSGAIHFGMMGEHAGVSWTHGLFFATTGWLQIMFAALIVFRPSRPVITAGIVLNVAILTVWVLTRTVGIAIGGDGTPEAWGKTDGLCAAFEGLAVIASVLLLSKSFSRRPLSSGVGFAGIGFVVIAIAVLSSLLFSPAAIDVSAASGLSPDGHNHGATGASADGHDHTHVAVAGAGGLIDTGNGFIVTGALTGDSPCELSGPPASAGQTGKDAEGHSHRGPFKQDPLTREEAAQLQAEQTIARGVAVKYPTVALAEAAGYSKSTPYVPCIGAHYTNTRLAGRFDPAAPSELLYDGTNPDSKIVGLSYLVFHRGGAPEGFTGPNDRWHQHNLNGGLCLKGGVVIGSESMSKAQCTAAGGGKVALDDIWMLHDWTVPGFECTWGVFAGECPELGGRGGQTAWDPPDPKFARKGQITQEASAAAK